MSDFLKKSSESEIDDILAQVKKSNMSADEQEVPSKTWSIDEIDRLIAQANGEEYVPPVKKEPTPAEDFERILSREFDTGIFTLRPMEEDQPVKEMQDISSMSGETEVDGQETFFEGKEDDFDESLFEIETVIVPEDEPKPAPPMFAWQEQPAEKESEPKSAPEIKTFYEGETAATEFFGKKNEEKSDETKVIDYKTRFFTTLKIENTAEIDPVEEGPVDRPGIVVRKSSEAAESGLEAMPRVLAAEDAKEMDDEKTRVMDAVGNAEKKISNAGNDVEGAHGL